MPGNFFRNRQLLPHIVQSEPGQKLLIPGISTLGPALAFLPDDDVGSVECRLVYCRYSAKARRNRARQAQMVLGRTVLLRLIMGLRSRLRACSPIWSRPTRARRRPLRPYYPPPIWFYRRHRSRMIRLPKHRRTRHRRHRSQICAPTITVKLAMPARSPCHCRGPAGHSASGYDPRSVADGPGTGPAGTPAGAIGKIAGTISPDARRASPNRARRRSAGRASPKSVDRLFGARRRQSPRVGATIAADRHVATVPCKPDLRNRWQSP